MEAVLRELLTTGMGLLSLFTIVFTLIMGAYISRFVRRKMAEDARRAAEAEAGSGAGRGA